jgi:hypothetical protein
VSSPRKRRSRQAPIAARSTIQPYSHWYQAARFPVLTGARVFRCGLRLGFAPEIVTADKPYPEILCIDE